MTRFAIAAAAAFLASHSAFAGDVYDFKIGGQSIHIEQPRNCNSASCVTVSIPGIYESGPKRKRTREMPDDQASVGRDKKETDTKPAPTDAAPAVAAPVLSPAPTAPRVATAPSDKSLEPANGTSNFPSSSAGLQPAAPSSGLAAPTVAAIQPAPSPSSPASVATSPLGVWLTEENEGKVRIEECGSSLCGYSVDAKTNANGDKVLINMKPGNDKWSGRIHDPKSGSTYDSTIAMKGSDRLRVQGCAFGGMFCGGQTWTRAN